MIVEQETNKMSKEIIHQRVKIDTKENEMCQKEIKYPKETNYAKLIKCPKEKKECQIWIIEIKKDKMDSKDVLLL